MRSESLIHDAAWATAKEILAVIAPVLRDDEVSLAFSEILDRVKTGMKAYHGKLLWLANRIPSNN